VTRWQPGGENAPNPPALVSFLLARLDDDETAALAAQAAIRAATEQALRSRFSDTPPSGDQALNSHAMVDHVSRHGPERVLRDVAAKRTVILLWRTVLTAQLADPDPACAMEALETAMAELAAVYTEDPSSQPGWLPHSRLNSLESPEPTPGGAPEPAPDNVIPFPSGRGSQPTPYD
jgi:Family of unknown function (DUF6221)